MSKDIQTIGLKPLGLKGRLAGLIMNLVHANQYKKIIKKYVFEKIEIKKSITILDIGCGGGKVINLFCSMFINSKIYGIDHSPDMVALAREVNQTEINRGKVDIVQSDVTALPYSNNYFDIITAFDTINFWTDFNKAMLEIKRVLKEDGKLLIVNEYPKEGTKWWDFVKFKNDEEYRKKLSEHGFGEIMITVEKNTIIIQAMKEQNSRGID
jgi:ubiquinone/menaquinone biosynthesis C-methylase UbiE